MTLALALLGSALGAPVTFDVESRGRVRTVDLHEPDGAARGAVILLHGAGGDRTFAQRTGLDVAAPAAGLALAVPDGTGFFRQSWRASPDCCGEAALWDSDDTLFLDALAVSLRERLDVDRIVVAGFSNGGMMAQAWACSSSAPSGVVSMAGPLLLESCDGPPIPVVIATGLGDANVPPAGGPSPSGTVMPSMAHGVTLWRDRNRCTTSTRHSSRRLEQTEWSCSAPVLEVEISRWGHRWPGGTAASRLGWDLAEPLLAMFDAPPAGATDAASGPSDAPTTEVP